jgi:hypothetical protein
MLGNPPVRHWVLVVSLDSRNISERVDSVLIVPFGSQGADGPTTLRFEPGETGLPGPSWLKGHFITTLKKSVLESVCRARFQRCACARSVWRFSARMTRIRQFVKRNDLRSGRPHS